MVTWLYLGKYHTLKIYTLSMPFWLSFKRYTLAIILSHHWRKKKPKACNPTSVNDPILAFDVPSVKQHEEWVWVSQSLNHPLLWASQVPEDPSPLLRAPQKPGYPSQLMRAPQVPEAGQRGFMWHNGNLPLAVAGELGEQIKTNSKWVTVKGLLVWVKICRGPLS